MQSSSAHLSCLSHLTVSLLLTTFPPPLTACEHVFCQGYRCFSRKFLPHVAHPVSRRPFVQNRFILIQLLLIRLCSNLLRVQRAASYTTSFFSPRTTTFQGLSMSNVSKSLASIPSSFQLDDTPSSQVDHFITVNPNLVSSISNYHARKLSSLKSPK